MAYDGFKIEKAGAVACLADVLLTKIESGAGANNVYFYSGTAII
jgi:hypothetical protein